MKHITFLMVLFFSFSALVSSEDARVCKHGFPLISGGLTEPGKMLFSIAQDMVASLENPPVETYSPLLSFPTLVIKLRTS